MAGRTGCGVKRGPWSAWCRVRDAVLRDAGATWSPAERLVALAVADSLAGPAGEAEIGQRLLAQRCALTRRTVQRVLARLTGPDGVFDVVPGGAEPGGRRIRSRYRVRARTGVTTTPVPASSGRPSDGRNHDTGDTSTPVTGVTSTPRRTLRSSSDAPRRVAARRVQRRNEGRDSGGSWSREACEAWLARWPGSTAPGGRIGSALGPLVNRHGWPEVRVAWVAYLADAEARFASPQRFAATFADWRPRRQPEREPDVLTGPEGEPLPYAGPGGQGRR